MTTPAMLYLTAGSGNSFKPALVLQQLGRQCARRFVDVLAGESRAADFLALNPRGQVPWLVLADGRGIGESNAIAWFLAEGSPLIPADPVSRAQALQWMIFEQTSLEPHIGSARLYTRFLPAQLPAQAHRLPGWQEGGRRGLAQLEAHLRGRDFLTDHGYSVADIAVFGYTHVADEGGFTLEDYPAVQAWIRRVEASAGFRPMSELLQP